MCNLLHARHHLVGLKMGCFVYKCMHVNAGNTARENFASILTKTKTLVIRTSIGTHTSKVKTCHLIWKLFSASNNTASNDNQLLKNRDFFNRCIYKRMRLYVRERGMVSS